MVISAAGRDPLRWPMAQASANAGAAWLLLAMGGVERRPVATLLAE